MRGKQYTPPEISAIILQALKKAAEEYLGSTVKDAVITVPAYFNDAQRQATKDAGLIAGLNVKRIINEPTAAALSFGLEKKKSGKVAVFDLGGGTFDISVLELNEGVFEVLATNGDTHLGGDDVDQVLVDHVADEFKKENGIDLRADTMALHRLREACEKAKIDLSTSMQTDLNLPFITADAAAPKHLTMSITRARFEQLVEPTLDRRAWAVQAGHGGRGREPVEITEVLLIGGSTQHPDGPGDRQGGLPAGGQQERQPRRGGRARRRHPGRCALRRRDAAGPAPARRHAAEPGRRGPGRDDAQLIERNATIPTKKAEVFSTADDNQAQGRGPRASRASAPWPRTIAAWAGSSWTAFPRPGAGSRRSRSPSTSTPTAS